MSKSFKEFFDNLYNNPRYNLLTDELDRLLKRKKPDVCLRQLIRIAKREGKNPDYIFNVLMMGTNTLISMRAAMLVFAIGSEHSEVNEHQKIIPVGWIKELITKINWDELDPCLAKLAYYAIVAGFDTRDKIYLTYPDIYQTVALRLI